MNKSVAYLFNAGSLEACLAHVTTSLASRCLLAALLLAGVVATMAKAETPLVDCCGAAGVLTDLDAPMSVAESIITSGLVAARLVADLSAPMSVAESTILSPRLAVRLTAFFSPPMVRAETLGLCCCGASGDLALIAASMADTKPINLASYRHLITLWMGTGVTAGGLLTRLLTRTRLLVCHAIDIFSCT